jgi:hypothetical protein
MLDLCCPVSGYTCAYSGNFLVCSFRSFPWGAASQLGLKWPGQGEVALASGKGRGEARLGSEGHIRLNSGSWPDTLLIALSIWYPYASTNYHGRWLLWVSWSVGRIGQRSHNWSRQKKSGVQQVTSDPFSLQLYSMCHLRKLVYSGSLLSLAPCGIMWSTAVPLLHPSHSPPSTQATTDSVH